MNIIVAEELQNQFESIKTQLDGKIKKDAVYEITTCKGFGKPKKVLLKASEPFTVMVDIRGGISVKCKRLKKNGELYAEEYYTFHRIGRVSILITAQKWA